MNEKIYILVFVLLVTAFFGALVSGLNAGLSERIELNKQVAEERVILALFGNEGINDMPAQEVARLFQEDIEAVTTGDYTYYRQRSGGSALCVIPMDGMGFWDRIKGYLAYDRASRTLKGIAFTENKETPGLGGRIEEPQWRVQFDGLTLGVPDNEGRYVRVVSPGSKHPERAEVDAVTGATGTSQAVERIVNASIRRFLERTQ